MKDKHQVELILPMKVVNKSDIKLLWFKSYAKTYNVEIKEERVILFNFNTFRFVIKETKIFIGEKKDILNVTKEYLEIIKECLN